MAPANDYTTTCIVVKNAPIHTQVDDLLNFFILSGFPRIHHFRVFQNTNGLSIFFIYFYDILSAISTVLNFNQINYFGRNLNITLHKDAKNEINNMLWGDYQKQPHFTITDLIYNNQNV